MGPSEKKPLGRILLQQKLVSPQQLEEALQRQKFEPGRLASKISETGSVDDVALLKALSEQSGVPGVDLNQVVIPLDNLDLVPKEIAEKHLILPILVREDRIFLAMADPEEKRVIDEMEFVTGKKVFPYVALHSVLTRVITEAYSLRARGSRYFQGPNVPAEYLAQLSREGGGPMAPAPLVVDDRMLQAANAVLAEPDEEDVVLDDPLEGLGADSATTTPRAKAPVAKKPPSAAPPVGHAGSPSPAPSGGPKKTVLVVDDEADIRRLIQRILQEKGMNVITAEKGLEALRLIKEQTPDLIVLDAMLPEVHGFDICRRLKGSQKYGHIPIVMISAVYRGWRFEKDLRESYGVERFIEKPFKVTDLSETVEQVLRKDAAPKRPADPDRLSEEAARELEAGIANYKKGDLEVAIAHLRRGVEIDPLAFKLHYHLALLYGKKGMVYQAIQELETSIDLNPTSFPALKNLAVLYQKAGFKHKAIEMWERALGPCPDEATRNEIKSHLVSLL